MQGILLKEGETISIEGKKPSEIYRDDHCGVIINNFEREIYLWKGENAKPQDRFKAAHLAKKMDNREFGGAGRIIQTGWKIQSAVKRDSIEDLSEKQLWCIKGH